MEEMMKANKLCKHDKKFFAAKSWNFVLLLTVMLMAFFPPLRAALNVSNSPSTSSVGPRVAVDYLGQVHVIWAELTGSSSGDLYYARGNRDATQWTTPINLSNSNKVYCPSLMMCGIDIDAANRVYAIYVDGSEVRMRIYADGSWGNPIILDSRQGVDAPRVAVTPNGDIFAIWWASSTYRVYSRARIGGTWESVREISSGPSKFPDIAVGSSRAVATWADKNAAADTYQSAYAERSRSLNASWSSPIWAVPSSYSQKHQAIELDSNDVPHLIWSTEIGGERLIEYSFWSGGGFVTPLAISSQVLLHYPNLAEANNNLFAAWQVGGYGNGSSIDFNSKIGGSWQGYASIPNSNGCTYSDVGVNPICDRAYYVWDTYAGSPGDIFIHVIALPSPITITTSPSGLKITVDSSTYTAPQSFYWAAGSSHTIGVTSPQSGSAGIRYVFSSWSDGGAQTHTITAPSSATTYTASFSTQYSLNTSVDPVGKGAVNPSGTNWYNSGQSVQVQATASSGYIFTNWSGDLSGTQNPASITMNGPKAVTANFSLIIPGGNKLRLLVRSSTGNEIYLNSLTTSGVWEGWDLLSGLTSDTPSAGVYNNLMHLVVKDAFNNNIWKNSGQDTNWTGWAPLDGETKAYVSMAVFNNKLYIAIVGTDSFIYYRSLDSNGAWSSWRKLNGTTTHTPAIAAFNNRLVIVVKSSANNNIWCNSMDTSENWSGWQVLDGETAAAPSLAVFNNKLYTAVAGTDGFIYYRSIDSSGNLSGWQRLNGTTKYSPAIVGFNNRLYLVVKSSTDTRLWLNSMDAAETWGNWQPLDGYTSRAPWLIVY